MESNLGPQPDPVKNVNLEVQILERGFTGNLMCNAVTEIISDCQEVVRIACPDHICWHQLDECRDLPPIDVSECEAKQLEVARTKIKAYFMDVVSAKFYEEYVSVELDMFLYGKGLLFGDTLVSVSDNFPCAVSVE